MAWLLLPGRHHLLTRFQFDYLKRAARPGSGIKGILWAVTSANHQNTRRNPLPAHRREAAIERFAARLPVPSFVYHIDDLGATERFAQYVLKKIEVDSGGRFKLTSANTIVACSTPEVTRLYERLGLTVLPVEPPRQKTPWQVLDALAKGDASGARVFLAETAPASLDLYRRYGYDELVIDLHKHPILTEDGDLTATRDYNSYARSFDDGAQRKYELIKDLVVPGRIVDIGCCAGALLRQLSFDDRLREADLYGIEVARPLYTECLHRKERGDFGQTNVFFHNADAVNRALFAPGSVQTVTTFALTHEVESYHGRQALSRFIKLLAGQLAPGGRWLNVDVVGPEDKDAVVLLWLNGKDGRQDDWQASFKDRARFKAYLDGLSTYARFLRFARDFRRKEGYRLAFRAAPAEEGCVRLTLRDACEFLSKKDYTDNWDSELHETFCYWSFSQWRAAIEAAGLRVHPASKAYTNPWIEKNRFAGKARLMRRTKTGLEPLPFPVTNMLLAAEKQ